MKRRNFFGVLFGMVIAPAGIVKALSSAPIELVLTSYPITGKPRKLKAIWTAEAHQDLQNFHSNAMYDVCAKNFSKEIQEEIDREVLATLAKNG